MKAPRMIAFALPLVVLACGSDAPTEPEPPPPPPPEAASLAYVGGAGQSAVVGSTLAQPLTVLVRDQNDDPYEGAAVQWRVTAGGGSLAPTSGTSGADGTAGAVWTLGRGPGTQEAIAYVTGVDTVVFTATAAPPPEPFEVEVDNALKSFALDAETNESRCEYTLTARATGGEAGEYAEWRSGELEWRKGGKLVESEFLSTQDLIDYWGSDRLETGETQVSDRYATWTGEFVLYYTFRFDLPSGESGSLSTDIRCEE